jgi:hypothetical protein
MTLGRFTQINQVITIISTKDVVSNKFKRDFKTVVYLETLFKKIYEPGISISIDECMMQFKGRIKNKVYSPTKPDK